MLTKRIIPCLDVKNGQVIKGIQFKNHEIIGDIINLAKKYSEDGADELVFYDIEASANNEFVDKSWIEKIALNINIPFCVAGGIRSIKKAEEILNFGADKISINSPALENPNLITKLADKFGSQCVVVGVDSLYVNNDYHVYQYTGKLDKTKFSGKKTREWIKEAQKLGAGEIVLNCMSEDGMKNGYDLKQLKIMKEEMQIPLIASGGAGTMEHFKQLFESVDVEGALAASVFHKNIFGIGNLKKYLQKFKTINVRK